MHGHLDASSDGRVVIGFRMRGLRGREWIRGETVARAESRSKVSNITVTSVPQLP